MSNPLSEVTIRRRIITTTARKMAAKRRKKIGKSPLRSAFRKLPASTRARLSRARSKFMKRFGKKIAKLRSSLDLPATLTGSIKHRPEYIKMVLEGARQVCEDHEDAREFAKHYLAKDPAFSNTDTGMAAILFEVKLVEFTGSMYGQFMETLVKGNEATFLAIFDGKLRKEEVERFANEVDDFVTFEVALKAGQISYEEGTVSDMTMLDCSPVPGARNYKLPDKSAGGDATQFRSEKGKEVPGTRLLPRSYESYEQVRDEGGLSDAVFTRLYADAVHESGSAEIKRATDSNGTAWLFHEGAWLPDTESLAEARDEKAFARKMKKKGYKVVLVLPKKEGEPLYFKTAGEASKISREEYPNAKIAPIDKFIGEGLGIRVIADLMDAAKELVKTAKGGAKKYYQAVLKGKRNEAAKLLKTEEGAAARAAMYKKAGVEESLDESYYDASMASTILGDKDKKPRNRLGLDWKNNRPISRVDELLDEYGEPDIIARDRVVWIDKEPFAELMIKDEVVPHMQPKPHVDFFYATINYPVPAAKVEDVLALTESIFYDPLKETLTARCDGMAPNVVTLHLAQRVSEGSLSTNIAERMYGPLIMRSMEDEAFLARLTEMVATQAMTVVESISESGQTGDDYVMVNVRMGKAVDNATPHKMTPEEAHERNLEFKKKGRGITWVKGSRIVNGKVVRGPGRKYDESTSGEDYIFVDARGKPLPGIGPNKMDPEEVKAANKSLKGGRKWVPALRTRHPVGESGQTGDDYVLVNAKGKPVPGAAPQKMPPEEVKATNKLLKVYRLTWVKALRTKHSAEESLDDAIQNPNTSGQGFDPDHKENPYHKIFIDAGLKYSHTTPVKVAGVPQMNHTYRLNPKFAASVRQDAKGMWRWEGGVSGSGRRTTGNTGGKLKAYLKRAVKRYGTAESLDESLYTEADNYIQSKFAAWCVRKSGTDDGKTIVSIGDHHFAIPYTIQEVKDGIDKIAEFYEDLPEEFDVMVEAFLEDFCADHGQVCNTNAVSTYPQTLFGEGEGYDFKESRDAVVERNNSLRLLALGNAPTTMQIEAGLIDTVSTDEAVPSAADASELSQAEALKLIKKSGLPARVFKKAIRTTGGMRKSTTVMLKPSKVDDETYDKFLDLRTNTGGEIIKTPKAKWVDVEGKDQYASFRVIHMTDVPESLDETMLGSLKVMAKDYGGDLAVKGKRVAVWFESSKKREQFARDVRMEYPDAKIKIAGKIVHVMLESLDEAKLPDTLYVVKDHEKTVKGVFADKSKAHALRKSVSRMDVQYGPAKVFKVTGGKRKLYMKAKFIGQGSVKSDLDESLDEAKDTPLPPGITGDPATWSKATQKKVVNYYAKWPLKKLRRHQDLIMAQQKRAGGNPKAMKRLQMIERLLAAAVDKREFGESLDEQKAKLKLKFQGKQITATEPTHLKALASKAGVSMKRALRLWAKAQIRVMKQYPEIKKKSSRYYQAATGIMKKMMKLPTTPLGASAESAEAFIIESLIVGPANLKGVMRAARKRPAMLNNMDGIKKQWERMVKDGTLAPTAAVGDLYHYEPIFWSGSQGTVQRTIGASIDEAHGDFVVRDPTNFVIHRNRDMRKVRSWLEQSGYEFVEGSAARGSGLWGIYEKDNEEYLLVREGLYEPPNEATRSMSIHQKAGLNAKTGRFPVKMRSSRSQARGHQKYGTSHPFDEALTKKDKMVLSAFADGKQASSKKLDSDGTTLDGLWMGGKGIATWKGGKVSLPDTGSKAGEAVQRALKKYVPKNQIAESVDTVSITEGQFDENHKEVLKALLGAQGRIDYRVFIDSFHGHKQAALNGAIAHLESAGMIQRRAHTAHGAKGHDLILTRPGYEAAKPLIEDEYQHEYNDRVHGLLNTEFELPEEDELFMRRVMGEDLDEGTLHVQVVDKLNDRMIQDVRGGMAMYKKMVKKYGKRSKQYVVQMVDVDTDKVLKATESLDEAEGKSRRIVKLLRSADFSSAPTMRKFVKDVMKLGVSEKAARKLISLKDKVRTRSPKLLVMDVTDIIFDPKYESVDEALSKTDQKMAMKLTQNLLLHRKQKNLKAEQDAHKKLLAFALKRDIDFNALLSQATKMLKKKGIAFGMMGLGAQESLEESLHVAKEIQKQIGRQSFMMMGAKQLVGDKKSLMWRVGKNPKGVTKVRVTLTPADEYNVEFIRIRKKKGVPEAKVLKTVKGIQVDQLHKTIQGGTGLRLSLTRSFEGQDEAFSRAIPELRAKAEKVGANKAALKKRLLSARSVLTREHRPKFKDATFNFKKKRLVSADGKYALQWENTGETSVGSVSLVRLKTTESIDEVSAKDIQQAIIDVVKTRPGMEVELTLISPKLPGAGFKRIQNAAKQLAKKGKIRYDGISIVSTVKEAAAV